MGRRGDRRGEGTVKPGLVLALLSVALTAAAAPASGAVRPVGAHGPLVTGRLSDERSITRWARPLERAKIRVGPKRSAWSVARLHPRTEDGYPEVYVAMRSHVGADGEPWVEVHVPMRPNGERGWVPRSALGRFHVVRTGLVIDRRSLTATLRRRGRVVWRSPVGVGRPGMPTPRGSFYVRELIRVPSPYGIYGPYAFGTSAYSVLSDWPGGGVVGIHGTDEPGLIPGRPSHGCVRVPNPRIRQLARLMPIGTPVRIR
jgi:L,D-transpeptidase-like protein